MEKQVDRIVSKTSNHMAPGLRSVDISNQELTNETFLVFSDFHMERPVFGPHPHAGVSVMTYMYPDSTGAFINRDSLGDHSRILPGGVHVTQAGRGIQHDEVPEHTGTDCHGFQIWINHADKDRLVLPQAYHADPSEIPEVVEEGVRIRIIQGSYQAQQAPFKMITPISLFDISLSPGASVRLPALEMAFVYVVSGQGTAGDHTFQAQDFVLFQAAGDEVKLNAGQSGLQCMFASGTPHREPMVFGGPFVMTTQDQMSATKKRFARGEMGELLPL